MSHKVRKKIDKAIGERKIFNDKDKKAIYTKIDQEEKDHPIKMHRKNKLPVIFAYASAAVLLFIFVSIGLHQQSDSVPQKHVDPISAQQHMKDQLQHRGNRSDDWFKKNVVLSMKKYADKFHIVKKMYYSLDYIHNAQGEFVWGTPDDTTRTIFYVDFDKKKSRSTNVYLKSGNVIQTTDLLLKDGMFTVELPKRDIFNKDPVEGDDLLGYLVRSNSFVTQSGRFGLISNNYSQWNYHIDTKFGMPVYKIKGTDPLSGPFVMTLSKDTGALLDLKIYDKNDKNKLTFFIAVKSIKINQGVPSGVFQLDVSGDKSLSWKGLGLRTTEGQFKMDKVCGPKCVDGHSK